MIAFPNCKINLGLNIIRKRSDGFHDLETVFYPLPLHDILEIIPVSDSSYIHDISFNTSGITIEGNKEDNLCIKAWRLIKEDFPNLPGIQMYLYKNIPTGAGLGGGSSDSVFTLRLLDRLFNLHISNEQLLQYCLRLGSDCAFFLVNKPSFASGRGELLEPVEPDLEMYKFVLVNPGILVHTANAFAQATPSEPEASSKEIIHKPVAEWKELLKNDFEETVFRQFPELKKIKDELYHAGAVYAAMSGSGSTLFGIFEKEKTVQMSFPSHYKIYEV